MTQKNHSYIYLRMTLGQKKNMKIILVEKQMLKLPESGTHLITFFSKIN